MNETTPFFQHEEDPHRLSFCDLVPLSAIAATPPPPSAEPDHLFEFSTAAGSYYADIIFCGKIIGDSNDQEELNEFQERDYFASVKSQSLREPNPADIKNRVRFSESTRLDRARGDSVYHAQRVNITSLTSMSAKSRRRMFMFGPVKFKPEMELGAIRERQAKMAAAAESRSKRHWGVVQSGLRGRSRLASVLARSLGCMPAPAGGGVDRWVGVDR